MNGIALGLAMVVYANGASPVRETPRTAIVPAAISFDLRDDVAMPREQSRVTFKKSLRPAWEDGSRPATPRTAARQRSRTASVIGASVGAIGGFMAGGAIGFAVAQDSKDDDGVSGLPGVVIGAPIGAVVGAILGYQLMK